MNSFRRDRVQFLKPDNGEESLAGYQNITCTSTSTDISNTIEAKNSIAYCIEKYQITIIATEFGIGHLKLPQFLEELGWTQKGNIAVIIRTNNSFDSENANVNYFSNEQLLKELFLDPILTKYVAVIVNDAHMHYALTDTILALLKKIARKRSTLKFIIISNTKEAIYFFDYFNTSKHHKDEQITCTILSIDNIVSKQNIFYLKSSCANYIGKAIETIRNIHQKQPLDGDILVYLADDDEINQAIGQLEAYVNMDHIKNINCLKLSYMNENQLSFFRKTSRKRNIIFTSDLKQDSVTQNRISYVIDCGFIQLKWFQSESNKAYKVTVPVSKFEADLRSKWISKYRTANIFRLYTKDDFNKLPERSISKLRRTDLCSVILYLKTLAIDNILRFDFPSAPPAKNVLSALETLFALDAINDQGQLTDPIGFFMADAPFCPCLSKVLFNSVQFQCSEEILIIAAMLQVESAFAFTTSNIAERHKQVAKRAFEAAEGDLITLLNVYTAFIENDKSKEFCHKYYLNYQNVMQAYNLRNYFANSLLNKYKMPLISCNGDVERILKCITSGYFMNVAYLHPSGVYRGLRCNSVLYIDRNSAISTLEQPKYLLYTKLYEKSKTFICNLTVIKEEWLSDLSHHYYQAK